MADDASILNMPADMIGHYNQQEAAGIVENLGQGFDPQFEAAYTLKSHPDHDRAVMIWNTLKTAANPPQELVDKPDIPRFERKATAPTTNIMQARAAQTEIKRLQGDPEFVRRYTAGNQEALATWNKLHEQAYPGDVAPDAASSEDDRLLADDATALVDQRQIDTTIPFKYGEDLSLEEIREQNAMLVQDLALAEKELGIPRAVAESHMKLIQASRELRGDRPHDALEKSTLNAILRDKWASNFEGRRAAFDAAMDRLGHKDTLGWNLQRIEPHMAAHIMDMLSKAGGQ